MFGRKRSAVLETLSSVSVVTDLSAEIEKRHDELAKLREGLSAATRETDRLIIEEQDQKDAMHRHAARALVKPEEQAEAERCYERARACREKRAELRFQIAAIEREIQEAERRLENLRNDLSRARRTAWEDILSQLVKQFGDEPREFFLQMWTALDQIYNGVPSIGVLQRIGIADQLDTETKVRMLDKLSDAYGMPKH